jgi:hypothetical protein
MLIACCLRFIGMVAVGGWLLIIEGLAQQQPRTVLPPLTNSNQSDSETNTTSKPSLPEALSTPRASPLTPLDEAYLDVFSILKEDSTCSAFYGGPAAVVVLNRLRQQIKPARMELESGLGLRMSGKTITITSFPHRLSFRLFATAQLNLAGPFYRSSSYSGQSIGGFLPNTREARATILLHELGHLIQRPDQQWVLPDDGGKKDLSQKNTARVVTACGKQINGLKGSSLPQPQHLR